MNFSLELLVVIDVKLKFDDFLAFLYKVFLVVLLKTISFTIFDWSQLSAKISLNLYWFQLTGLNLDFGSKYNSIRYITWNGL